MFLTLKNLALAASLMSAPATLETPTLMRGYRTVSECLVALDHLDPLTRAASACVTDEGDLTDE